MSQMLDALKALARPEDRMLWAIVALVVGYFVLGAVAARRARDSGPVKGP